MRKEIRRRHDAHTRANAVCNEHSAVYDATPGGAKIRAALSKSVRDVDRLLAFQQRCIEDRRAATADIQRLREKIMQATRTIVRVGRLIDLPDTPTQTLQLPIHMAHDDLVAYARGLLDYVSPYTDTLVAEGVPQNALATLPDTLQRLEVARAAQVTARQRFTVASEPIRAALETATETIAALEAIAVSTPDAPPELVTKLRIAKRVGPRAARPGDDGQDAGAGATGPATVVPISMPTSIETTGGPKTRSA